MSSSSEGKSKECSAGTFFRSKVLNEETISYETIVLDMLFFNVVMKDLATRSWKEMMLSVVTWMSVAAS